MRFLCLIFALGVLQLAAAKAPSCKDLGGSCQTPLNAECAFGEPLPVNCGINAKCCPRPRTCTQLGGKCVTPLFGSCPSGVGYPANCGINGRCCKPK